MGDPARWSLSLSGRSRRTHRRLARLKPARGVRLPLAEPDGPAHEVGTSISHPPSDREARSLAGWLVDIEEP